MKIINKQKGFSLIELMIVVAILGIIVSIAIPSYSDYVRKGNRTDAKVGLLKIAQIQESFFVQHLSYAKSLSTTAANGGLNLGATVESENKLYTMFLTSTPNGCTGSAVTPCTGFTLEAKAVASKAQDLDIKCHAYEVSNTGRKRAKTKTGSYSTTQGEECW